MVENLEEVVVVIKLIMKKNVLFICTLTLFRLGFAQQNDPKIYKKRVLETTEVDFLSSYYEQDGDNASVTGGIGTERLTDVTPTIVVTMPLNADDVLTVDLGVSAYSSASSSNLNPFDGATGASWVYDDTDDKPGANKLNNSAPGPIGSPWVASSGASSEDVWTSISANYAHSSNDRNRIWNANVSFASEYDYLSIGFGAGYAKLFNEKNTEISVSTNVYLDTWYPEYPTELDSYIEVSGNLNRGFFSGVNILDQRGQIINKNATNGSVWNPKSASGLIENKSRNSFSLAFGFSQILTKNSQIAFFFDIVQQQGWLANPMQRVYFGDVDNFFIGNASSIENYSTISNRDVFQLADDIERLPNKRFKVPLGFRFNQYINERVTLRTYYRYYLDDWGIRSHTAEIELPIKLFDSFTLYPSYRFYNQTAADYFAPFDQHLSTDMFYTSDYDLSQFNANQYGIGVSYTDIFTKVHIWKLGLKNIDVKYNNYKRNTGLTAQIISASFKFVID